MLRENWPSILMAVKYCSYKMTDVMMTGTGHGTRYLLSHIEYHDISYIYIMISEYGEKCFHSRWVRASYGVASAYVLADTADKGQKMNKVRRLESAQQCSCDFMFLFCSDARFRLGESRPCGFRHSRVASLRLCHCPR